MKNLLLPFFVCCVNFINAQAPTAGDLIKIHNITDAEMNAIVNPEEGSYAYNTTNKAMYFYNGADWVEMTANTANVYVGQFIITALGNQTITGIPFEPSQITFAAHANIEALNIDSDNAVGNNNNGIPNAFGSMNGFARNDGGAIVQQVTYVGGNGNSINDISRYASNTRCIGLRYGNQNGDAVGRTLASLTAFNNDGFTINVTNKDDNVLVLYTAYK